MTLKDTIELASNIAYEEDSNQVVGKIEGKWAVRGWEDPEADTMAESFIVNAAGPLSEYIGTVLTADWELMTEV